MSAGVRPIISLASSPIANVAAAFKTVTDFISARNFVGRVADLSAIGTHTFFWVANKVVSLIGDIGSTVGWLAGIKVFGDATSKEILEKSWWSVQGKSVTFLDEVGKYSCVSSAVLDIETAGGAHCDTATMNAGFLAGRDRRDNHVASLKPLDCFAA